MGLKRAETIRYETLNYTSLNIIAERILQASKEGGFFIVIGDEDIKITDQDLNVLKMYGYTITEDSMSVNISWE